MAAAAAETVLEIYSAVQGRKEVVETEHGPVEVTVCGDPAKHPCVTFHDVGLCHGTAFQGLLVVSRSARRSLLLDRFCFYHVDAPGSQEGAAGVPAGWRGMTVAKLARVLPAVLAHFRLRGVLGLGVGAGGYLVAKAAAQLPGAFAGLILVSPLCQAPGWFEYAYGLAALAHLKAYGWTDWGVDHVLMRLFSSQARGFNGWSYGNGLIQTFKREVAQRDPEAVREFLSAVLHRKDLSAEVRRIRCPCLVLNGDLGGYSAEALHLSSLLDRTRSALVNIEHAGALVTEERPQDMLRSIALFLEGLQQRGVFL